MDPTPSPKIPEEDNVEWSSAVSRSVWPTAMYMDTTKQINKPERTNKQTNQPNNQRKNQCVYGNVSFGD